MLKKYQESHEEANKFGTQIELYFKLGKFPIAITERFSRWCHAEHGHGKALQPAIHLSVFLFGIRLPRLLSKKGEPEKNYNSLLDSIRENIQTTVQQRIVRFLKNCHLDNERSWKALVFGDGLDSMIEQAHFDITQANFAELLVEHLDKLGTLSDGRKALVALLQAIREYISWDGPNGCAELICEIEELIYEIIEE